MGHVKFVTIFCKWKIIENNISKDYKQDESHKIKRGDEFF